MKRGQLRLVRLLVACGFSAILLDLPTPLCGQNVFPNPGNVGIGTTSPQYPLEVYGHVGVNNGGEFISNLSSAVANFRMVAGSYGVFFRNDGANTYLLITPSGSQYSLWNSLRPFYVENASGHVHLGQTMFVQHGGNVGIGTTNPAYKLSVKGPIGAQEVVILDTSSWADYVFQPSYRLRPLPEVAAYIRENHHLPEIPTAKEVHENGVGLAEMQVKLLAKVEENRELRERLVRLEKLSIETKR